MYSTFIYFLVVHNHV